MADAKKPEEKGWLDQAADAAVSATGKVVRAADNARTSVGNAVTGGNNVSATDKAIADAKRYGLTQPGQAEKFVEQATLMGNINELLENPKIKSLSQDKKDLIGKAVVQKWQENPTLLKNFNSDLGKDTSLSAKIADLAAKNPSAVAGVVKGYNGGNAAELVTSASVAPTAKPQVSAAKAPSETAAPVAATSQTSAAPVVKASAQPRSTAPTSSAPASIPAAVAAAPVAAPLPAQAVGQPARGASTNPSLEAFKSLANADDQTIKDAMSGPMIAGIADGMADEAVNKFGVSSNLAEAFASRISENPGLRSKVVENFKNNPQFVRELAKSMKSNEPLPEGVREIAKKTMVGVMENPEKLADDKYVKNLTSQMQMGSTFSTGMGFMKNMFGIDLGGKMSGIMGGFEQFFKKIMHFVDQFTGGNFISMRNSGMSLSKSLGAAWDQAGSYENVAANGIKYLKPLSATADGKFYKTEQVKQADGSVINREVANTVTVKSLSGQDLKIVPATGLQAVRDPRTGNVSFIAIKEGGVEKDGKLKGASETMQVTLSREEFAKYNQQVASLNGGRGMEVADRVPMNVAEVDRRSGVVSPPREYVYGNEGRNAAPQPTLVADANKPPPVQDPSMGMAAGG